MKNVEKGSFWDRRGGGALQKNSVYINTSKNKVHAIFIFELNDSKSADQSSTPLDYNGIEIRR